MTTNLIPPKFCSYFYILLVTRPASHVCNIGTNEENKDWVFSEVFVHLLTKFLTFPKGSPSKYKEVGSLKYEG